ncbi:atp18 subunit J of the mitochondrial F1F0 ATP synthase [Taxawa tesnikishii (nom. ined.)]|nr:atp18 subunit J of the mitochondrial F1F0 ATP synthase [Dothideales sp. JES 119]
MAGEGLLGKKFPAPVARPMAPFYIAGVIIFYGVNSLATRLADTDEYRNDPRNPKSKTSQQGHHDTAH